MFLSYFGKTAKLIKFDGEYEYFCTGKIEKLQIYPNLTMCMSLNRLFLKIYDFFLTFHVCAKYTLLSGIKVCSKFTRFISNTTKKFESAQILLRKSEQKIAH